MGTAAEIEARWLLIRATGISVSALLIARAIPPALGPWVLPAAAAGTTVAHALASETLRTLAGRNPEQSAPLLLLVLHPLDLLVAPISAPILWLARTLGSLRVKDAAPTSRVTETEVELIVNEGELNGSLGRDQSEMIRNVLEFGDVNARQVMVPRTQVTALPITLELEEAVKRIAEVAHSRYPVYRDSVDNVIGLLYAKDLLRSATRGQLPGGTLEGLLRTPVAFVPETQSASSVLKDMRAGRQHMAIVIDEFGGMSGILTLEDLLEQIVGDIKDEHDSEDPPIVDLGDGRLVVDASIPLSDLSRYLGADLPVDGDYHSLGGFVAAQLGRVPEVGTRLTAFNLIFKVLEADERRVCKVEITRLPTPESLAPRSTSRVSAA